VTIRRVVPDIRTDDLDGSRRFYGLLGFVEDKAVVIKGPVMDAYMGVPGIEADHVTLVLRGVAPRLEVQLLRYRHPEPLADPNIERLEKVGFNHVRFVVDDIEAEMARLRAQGIAMRNEPGTTCLRLMIRLRIWTLSRRSQE